ncbi:hypothetical protein BBAG_1536 [Bifidobacterium angulatum DSM 20098 = JCM 7096]|nr:hypothetical protein BBAG_1536 [Bifidobacterium angulatum DSM 20098 = JCM 7096]
MATHGGGGGDIHVRWLSLLYSDALGVLQLLANLISELFSRNGRLRCSDLGHLL